MTAKPLAGGRPRQLPLPFSFNPTQSFEEFHAGDNVEPLEHLRALAENRGETLIFLWGPTGSGKTHLLNACCRAASALNRRAAYLPLELLRAAGPEAVQGLEHFDLVCLDDAEAIAGDAASETALFNLFNRLREGGRSIVIGARQPPAGLLITLPDLATRLGWGLTLRLQLLADSDKLAVLERYAASLGMDLPPGVGRFLLVHCRRELPALRALLEQLDHASLAAQRRLSLPFVKAFLEQRG